MLFCKISKCLTNIQIWPAQYLIITSISWVHSNFIGLQANLTHLHSSINKNSIKLDYLQDVYYSGLLCYVTSRDVQRIQSKGVDKGSWFQMSWEIYPQLNIYLQTRLIVLNDQSTTEVWNIFKTMHFVFARKNVPACYWKILGCPVASGRKDPNNLILKMR